MPDDAERNPPIQEQMDGGELVRTRTVQDRQRGPAGCSGGILGAAQAPPRLDTDAHAPAPNAQPPHHVGHASVGRRHLRFRLFRACRRRTPSGRHSCTHTEKTHAGWLSTPIGWSSSRTAGWQQTRSRMVASTNADQNGRRKWPWRRTAARPIAAAADDATRRRPPQDVCRPRRRRTWWSGVCGPRDALRKSPL